MAAPPSLLLPLAPAGRGLAPGGGGGGGSVGGVGGGGFFGVGGGFDSSPNPASRLGVFSA
jgi:hypothetical protein